MKQHLCRVADNRILWHETQILTFDAPELAPQMRPGQFALVRDPATFDPYLRRTAWFYQTTGERVAFTLPACDPLVTRTRVGDTLDVLAPLGRAVEFDARARHILLVGEGARTAPLIAIAQHAIERGRAVVLAGQSVSAEQAFPAHLLSPEIEYHGGRDVLDTELLAWADAIVASGSDDLYRALAESVRAARYRLETGFARVLMDIAMPCGTGACYACAVETARGVRLACADGPAFDLAEFVMARARR
ncbi:MAG: hypothetical protein HY782_07520 [Chloroflexi bacterium]|nr:hypothetical protein [Chloroflexota bacterium]